jgi:phosphate butyryltransferase
MGDKQQIDRAIEDIRKTLITSGRLHHEASPDQQPPQSEQLSLVPELERALLAARDAQEELHHISKHLHDLVVRRVLDIQDTVGDPDGFDALADLLERILSAVEPYRQEPSFVKVYGELLSVYILTLYRCAAPGRESPIIKAILKSLTTRKATDLGRARLDDVFKKTEHKVTIALIAKRYALYVLACKGLRFLFRREVSFQSAGKSPANLALEITNILLRQGIPLSDVTEIVCGGGDLGALPGGMYVLDGKVLEESRKRLGNSSLNRGALVGFELKEVLKKQGNQDGIHLSMASPLSFTTLDARGLNSFLQADSNELSRSLKGYVKLTPLKSIAALISEIRGTRYEDINLLVMTLDELFASVVRKTGPRIVREVAAQEANESLSRFDFQKIRDALRKESFVIPEDFRLASSEIGTGVKEICELLMIVESGAISHELAQDLMHVVDTYALRVAGVLEMASAGVAEERPHFMVITSMMALDPYFLQLFAKIRNRIQNPYTPLICLDSLEHEYLVAKHLFELYFNPAGDRRLRFSVEARSVKSALQVLQAPAARSGTFSFSRLLEETSDSIAGGEINPGNLCLVGADNDEALLAVTNAREYGIIKRMVLIGAPREIRAAADLRGIKISPEKDDDIEILPIDPLAADQESKNKSMAQVFHDFLADNPDFFIMKGSLPTAAVLRQALSIYRKTSGAEEAEGTHRTLASNTALFVLPDGRFFAISDAAVNPSFNRPEDLLKAIENQIDVVRRVVDPQIILKVAIVTAVEKQTSAIPATYLAAHTAEMAGALQDRYGPLIVEGPLSFDLATVPDVAEEKHYDGEIKGDANCLVTTNINTANVLYKMLSKTMGSLGLIVDNGAIITAGPGTIPIVLTSRGDTAQTKFNSILLAYAYSCRGDRLSTLCSTG